MKKYGLLVVDNSSFMRRCISLIIEKDPALFVIAIARNGRDAIEKIERLQPDLVTMDLEMPEMNGLEALEVIMKKCPVPVVMLSNHTEEGAQSTIKALELGAVDVILKSHLVSDCANPAVIADFLHRIKSLAKEASIKKEKLALQAQEESFVEQKKVVTVREKPFVNGACKLLIIGSSTGGPSALQSILPRFSKDTAIPIVVLQHMPEGFTKALAERFNNFCQLPVKEAEKGEYLLPGRIYIGPAGFQTRLQQDQDGSVYFHVYTTESESHLYKPSINITLFSAAPIYRENLLTVILTGMGNDGMEGCKKVKHYQGTVIVEAEESCIVYGMPKAVHEAGYADIKVPLPHIYQQVLRFI
ncbi:protein-glutamate methylesterase/protein-glutamine glutaminase [Heliorestis convoluta]|uniref:Protein-glutamate methylesterase/protein-glutamine glutaminase n=1 Tax=Heliorestis convoluta TaxID=356322 RepID=A0A5Q2N3Y9_9FIRM|nr:chemotaxis response regulator protein-glutamate methylesterase [Heliorestis convoluta]QGG48613.1 cheB methylesterase family protein [Heliorestis convoluta]